MIQNADHFDVLVIGGGPAGQKAAIQAAKVGERVLLVERGDVGGECVHRGTIPSKTLRESAVGLAGLRTRFGSLLAVELGADLEVRTLMRRLTDVLRGHEAFLEDQLERNGVEHLRARARFLDEHRVELTRSDGSKRIVEAELVFVATGSRPRKPPEIPVDHEHILDSDSVLSMIYLPKSMIVVGAGVIACEFATIFQALGVQVTLLDKYPAPLGFLDPELSARFVERFEEAGGRFLPDAKLESLEFDGVGAVSAALADGTVLRADKALVALGRTACVAGLGLEAAGVEVTERGFVAVDENCRTSTPNVYAMGDVIGPPALATASMEQGRRAARHALGLPAPDELEVIPVGVYTIPEIACIGLTEQQAIEAGETPVVGRAPFGEIARGLINEQSDGLLKLVCDSAGRRILGAHVIGAGATELVHLAQLAMVGKQPVDVFVDHIFNFPTMAECYRVAALDVIGRRPTAIPLAS